MNEITQGQNLDAEKQYQIICNTINDIFKALKAYYTSYGVVMKTQDLEVSIREQWVYEIVKSNINDDMLVIGVSRAKAHASEDKFCKWPSIGDFISWCYELPTPENAYYEAASNCHDLTIWDPSHPIVALAGQGNWFDIRTERNPREIKSAYCKRYNALFARVIAGEKFEYEKLVLIEKQPPHERTEQEISYAHEQIEEVKKIVGSKDEVKLTEPSTESFESKKEKVMQEAKKWMEGKGSK